jgi:hypothetical protein
VVVAVCGSAEIEGEVVILKMRRLKLNCSRVDWSRLGSREVNVPLSFAYPALLDVFETYFLSVDVNNILNRRFAVK